VIDVIAADHSLSVSEITQVLGVSRSAYYSWRREGPTQREQRDEVLVPLVTEIFWQHKQRYGARRIAHELQARGIACGVDRVAKLMKIAGLRALAPKSFTPKTTQSRHGLGYSPNLIADQPSPHAINQLWVADITYIPLADGSFCYLSVMMDRFSRKIIAWNLQAHMTEALVVGTLRQALRSRAVVEELIHHSDRGGQYAGTRFRGMLRRANIQQSMSGKGNCYDNAFMESCFGTIKTELQMTDYQDIETARQKIGEYIAYYNTSRRHSSLDYLSPSQFEALNTASK
jgi:transposase InsO family protein